MRVLGVDPGLTRCGIGVVDSLPGRRAALVAVDVLRSDPAATVDLRTSANLRSMVAPQGPVLCHGTSRRQGKGSNVAKFFF